MVQQVSERSGWEALLYGFKPAAVSSSGLRVYDDKWLVRGMFTEPTGTVIIVSPQAADRCGGAFLDVDDMLERVFGRQR
jgi:hypothetical protein